MMLLLEHGKEITYRVDELAQSFAEVRNARHDLVEGDGLSAPV